MEERRKRPKPGTIGERYERRDLPIDPGGGTPIKGGRRKVSNNPRDIRDRENDLGIDAGWMDNPDNNK